MNANTCGYLPGLIAAADLDPIVAYSLQHGLGTFDFVNHTYEAARHEAEAVARLNWEDHCERMADQVAEAGCVLDDFHFDEEEFAASYRQGPEELVSGTLDHVQYSSRWDGAALYFAITRSPLVATEGGRHPDWPGYGVLRHPSAREGRDLAFDVPPTWWRVDESADNFDPLEDV